MRQIIEMGVFQAAGLLIQNQQAGLVALQGRALRDLRFGQGIVVSCEQEILRVNGNSVGGAEHEEIFQIPRIEGCGGVSGRVNVYLLFCMQFRDLRQADVLNNVGPGRALRF